MADELGLVVKTVENKIELAALEGGIKGIESLTKGLGHRLLVIRKIKDNRSVRRMGECVAAPKGVHDRDHDLTAR
jgi:hypothetical protein